VLLSNRRLSLQKGNGPRVIGNRILTGADVTPEVSPLRPLRRPLRALRETQATLTLWAEEPYSL